MDDHLSKWLQGEISNEELKNQIGSEEAAKYLQIINEVDNWVPDHSEKLFDTSDLLQTKEAKVRSIGSWMTYSVAASLLVAVAAYLLFFTGSSMVTHTTGIAEIKEITLPDQYSVIHLAPNSEISWNKNDWSTAQIAEKARLKSKRKVKLKGKALFKVSKGSPFEVNTEIGSVEVLGTTFEVDDFGNGMNVICFEGKVKAESKEGKEVIVNGGDSYLFFEGKWEDRIEVTGSAPSWLNSKTTFENAPLSQVLKSIEKLYKITFETGSTNIKKRFSGTIPNDNIEVALRIVFDPYNIKYVRKGDILYLTD